MVFSGQVVTFRIGGSMFSFEFLSYITVDYLISYFVIGCLIGIVFKLIFEFATLCQSDFLIVLRMFLWPIYFLVIFAREAQIRILKHTTWKWLPNLPVSHYSYNEYVLTMGVFWVPKLCMIVLGWLFVIFYCILVFILVVHEAMNEDL